MPRKKKKNPGNTQAAYRNKTIGGTTHKHQMTDFFFFFLYRASHTEMEEMNKKKRPDDV